MVTPPPVKTPPISERRVAHYGRNEAESYMFYAVYYLGSGVCSLWSARAQLSGIKRIVSIALYVYEEYLS